MRLSSHERAFHTPAGPSEGPHTGAAGAPDVRGQPRAQRGRCHWSLVSEPPTHPRSAHECGSGSFSPSASLLAPSGGRRPVGRCRSQQLRWRGRGAGDTDVSRTRTSFSALMEARSEDGGGAVGRGDRVSSFRRYRSLGCMCPPLVSSCLCQSHQAQRAQLTPRRGSVTVGLVVKPRALAPTSYVVPVHL